MGVRFYENANQADCIRCLKCLSSCPFDAISCEVAGVPARRRSPVGDCARAD
jgi:ferredoxin